MFIKDDHRTSKSVSDELLVEGTSTHTHETSNPSHGERDEVKEIQRLSHADTRRIRTWRFIMLTAILATAVAVALFTYTFLREERQHNFETAFEGLASTIEVATLDQQRNIREGFEAMSNAMTGFAKTTNATWPFVTLKYFEMYGANLRRQSLIEAFWIANRVEHDDLEDYLEYIDTHYEADVAESFEVDPSTKEYFEGGMYEPYLRIKTSEGFVRDRERDEYYPLYQQSPPMFNYLLINYNLQGVQDYVDIIGASLELQNETTFTRVRPYSAFTDKDHARLHSQRLQDETVDHPHSFVYYPIHEEVSNTSSKIVGFVQGAAAWDTAIRNLIPEGIRGIYAVISNNCNQSFTYELVGSEAFFMGNGDLHEVEYDDLEVFIDLMQLHHHPKYTTTPGHCMYELRVYPGRAFHAIYDTNTPEVFLVVVSLTFAVMVLVFVVYDLLVQRRNNKLILNAAQSSAILSSMFPSQFRDRLMGDGTGENNKGIQSLKTYMKNGAKSRGPGGQESKPLADLFLEATLIFADIVGFTAWSSTREPPQVFELLEQVYASFDEIAEKRRVFKVETVGDCYVAATGIPDPIANHALVMIRFARQILAKFATVTKKLDVVLGPDTADLSLRIGIHSGPVTAGVLRGTRARFQLFGDTMNTASRIESTGAANRIHVSPMTANLLTQAGKGHWLVKREDVVTIRGKSDIITYWIKDTTDSEYSPRKNFNRDEDKSSTHDNDDNHIGESHPQERFDRLVEWNVSTLLRLIKEMISHRVSTMSPTAPKGKSARSERNYAATSLTEPLQEVKEIITLPEFNYASPKKSVSEIEVSEHVVEQLRLYVACVARMYRPNAFHNFEHASHVTMSVTKLLSRIVAPTELELDGTSKHAESVHLATLHDHTYGITSDPLTQFACAFSALIHDVDHTGVPNAQLIKEGSTLATFYHNRSMAEQNSLVLAWQLLFEPQFDQLRDTICPTQAELIRFRELIVNSVMATDIADKDLKALRNNRWEKAFSQDRSKLENPRDAVNRKATIVIEHLIQASDVSHTMQHWHVYRKWNECLFCESYAAYKAGRAEKDPSDGWYKGEIGFFDFYIIPLAKKLKDCGVFGKSSDEFLNYALQNRAEWEVQGQEIVAKMIEKIKAEERPECAI